MKKKSFRGRRSQNLETKQPMKGSAFKSYLTKYLKGMCLQK